MTEPFKDPATIQDWHGHVYFDPTATRAAAETVRAGIAEAFPNVTLGRWHDVPVGPHTQAMYQIAFAVAHYAAFVPWLALNRHGLAVLIHPNTGRQRADHMVHAMWLGAILPLKAESLPE
jgi:DOPA 4,5-dioxygenase